jgi:hypothetical protein
MEHRVDNGFKLLWMAVLKLLSSNYTEFIVNLGMTTLIGIHSSVSKHDKKWLILLILYIIVDAILNLMLIIIREHQKGKEKWKYLYKYMYQEHSRLYTEISSHTYRINKEIIKTIRENQPVTIDCYNKIHDFQALAMEVCKSINHTISDKIKECSCQVTIMQRIKLSDDKDGCKMLGYSNKYEKEPASFHTEFKLKGKDKTIFQKIFCNTETTTIILKNRKEVTKEFIELKTSKTREGDICQYIGIPIKSNRNLIEFVLQVDVSIPGILGKNNKEIFQFSEMIMPYANLLSMQYERELIFTKFYELLSTNLPKGVIQDVC